MNLDHVEKIAEAVLYEGYMLYPYRPSSVKNQQRWNFGVLCPTSYCEQQHGTERDTMQTELLVRGNPDAALTVKARFLQIIRRSIGKLHVPVSSLGPDAEAAVDFVERLEANGRVYQAWQEAVERQIVCDELRVGALAPPISFPFDFPRHREVEPVLGDGDTVVGIIVREWEHLSGSVEITTARVLDDIFRLRVLIRNQSAFAPAPERRREDAVPFSLVSAHTILGVQDGEFLSARAASQLRVAGSGVPECRNLASAGRRAGFTAGHAVIAHHPLRLSADCSGERGQPLRWNRDRRNPLVADYDADR